MTCSRAATRGKTRVDVRIELREIGERLLRRFDERLLPCLESRAGDRHMVRALTGEPARFGLVGER